MSEPEELLIEGAHIATRVVRDVWRRYGLVRDRAEMFLADERSRLELFLTAVFMRPIAVGASEPPAPATFLARLAQRRPPAAVGPTLLPATDDARVLLPPSLPVNGDEEDARELYRLLAVEQGARLVRGTARAAAALGVHDAGVAARDRFLVREAADVDRWIAFELPGLLPCLRRQRSRALASRSSDNASSDQPLEQAVRGLLASDPTHELTTEVDVVETGGRYRPLRPVWYWGQVLAPSKGTQSPRFLESQEAAERGTPPRVAEMRRRPRIRKEDQDEDDRGTGAWIIRADEPQESVEDPRGLQRPTDRDDHADPDALGDSLSDLHEARVVRTPGQAREVLRSGDEVARAGAASAVPKPCGIVYPEWDYREGTYRHPGAIVREPAARTGDPGWASAALAKHGRLVRRVRARFERMQPRRARLGRQPDGPEIDLDAFVTSAADARAEVSGDGRLYVEDRPARRELAVALLVDVSASTDAWVSANRRIVDVEKEALLIVCEALEALGDRYAIFTFSGRSARDISVAPIKRFDDRYSPVVQQRIAALDSERYTRMGAAIRHLAVPLSRERPDRRLLLVLSDGKPNDEDIYEGQYGVEDTRQAVAEARRQGIAVFCLTVDRTAPRYAARIFGRPGFAVLRRAEELPAVIVDVLRQLVRA